MPIPEILIVAPPKIIEPKCVIANKFKGAETRCIGLSSELEKIAKEQSTMFFDTEVVTASSHLDGIHLDEDQHRLLGEAIAQVVSEKIVF